jgi:hypothetical protein
MRAESSGLLDAYRYACILRMLALLRVIRREKRENWPDPNLPALSLANIIFSTCIGASGAKISANIHFSHAVCTWKGRRLYPQFENMA